MKKMFSFLLMLISMSLAMAQSSITVKFTAETSSGDYCKLAEVSVTNITQGWSQTLVYPDTILVMTYTDGMTEFAKEDGLLQNHPNPFYGSTEADLVVAESGNALLRLIRLDGKVIAERNTYLEAGEHHINVTMADVQMAFLHVATANSSHAIKLLNLGHGGTNNIEVIPDLKQNEKHSKAGGTGTIAPGDIMSYTGIAILDGNTVGSNTVTQEQNNNEVITLVFNDEVPTEPQLSIVITANLSDISYFTAQCGGNVLSDGNAAVTARGVCWSTSPNPTTANPKTVDGSGLGAFTSTLTGLAAGTTYYVRAYATNAVGTAYGEERVLTTLVETTLPVVTTAQVSDIANYTASCGGNVLSDGNSAVTARGVCWSTSPNPTTANPKTVDGSGLGAFTSTMTGLAAGTTYYVRAYAINAVGTAYGEERVLTTLVETTLPIVTTAQISDIANYTASCGGNVLNDGNAAVTARGVCWSTSPNPTTANPKTIDGSGLGAFSSTLTGLAAGTTYYVRAYATNSVGTAYGEERILTTLVEITLPIVATAQISNIGNYTASCGGNVLSDGNSTVTARGVCWSTSPNPTTANPKTVDGSGPGAFTSTLTGLAAGTTYYVRAYATNSVGTAYGYERILTTLVETTLPIVTTAQVSAIGNYTASCGGNVLSSGISAITARGVCWSTSQNPTINDSHTSDSIGIGSFTSYLTELEDNTLYHVRAYATNSNGTNYGAQKQFKTLPVGAINGRYTVSGTRKVYFSKGNLQYQALTDTWRFAENQWDYVGCQKPSNGIAEGTVTGSDNAYISPNCNSWIDLFGWGTGENPTNTSADYDDYSTFTDWGNNPISNGGDQAYLWRTLKKDEWESIFYTRVTPSGIRFVKATVNGVTGVIILPDDWSASYYTLNNANSTYASFSANIITSANWLSLFETHGAVFLPAAGYRQISPFGYFGTEGNYWSSTPQESGCGYYGYCDAYCLAFNNNSGDFGTIDTHRQYGRSVRLVYTESAPPSYYIGVASNPTYGGTVTGSGTYDHGQACTLTATPANGYVFSNWTENEEVVSTNAIYSFNVSKNSSLVANFIPQTIVPTGGANGLFSVSDTNRVYFSKGNLQYQASTDTWRFAENQWDYVGTQQIPSGCSGCVVGGTVSGSDNADISSTYSGWIDLFGWGTGNNPTESSTSSSDYNTFVDWGVNPISNGGNQANKWRTLTKEEWKYLIFTRTTDSGIRYAKATVNGVNGVIILPDDWNASYYTLNNVNTTDAAFATNNITTIIWTSQLEAHGAVFLPAAGYRSETIIGTVIHGVNEFGYYWPSMFNYNSNSYHLEFYNGNLYVQSGGSLCYGLSVRLIYTEKYSVEATSNPTNGGTVTGTGLYEYGQTCTLTAIPVSGFSFSNWTENGDVVSTDASYTFSVKGNRNLIANFKTYEAPPIGGIDGLFSVSGTTRVYFSKGNLQYQASTDTWRFAESQWDFIGADNANISPTYNGWIDLFGWGTGNNPTNSSTSDSAYASFTDWGINPISNGGNTACQWRTLTRDEWDYLVNIRTTFSGIRHAKAMVNDVAGVIILPDDWSNSYYTLSETNSSGTSFSTNTITLVDWLSKFETHGAVFLPAAGYRNGTSIGGVGSNGCYWTPSKYDNEDYSTYPFYPLVLHVIAHGNCCYGQSVRMVYTESIPSSCSIEATPNLTEGGTVIGNGTYNHGQTCTLTATPSNGYLFSNWTENGEVVSVKATYSFFVSNNRNLVANFIYENNVPIYITDGLFSVSNTNRVYFSKGNLQYQASTDTWRFAENQWDIIGNGNVNISPTYSGWIDLFGYGTGNNPTNSSTSNSSYSTFTDWGINPISNGGNTPNQWYTPTCEEWGFLLFDRITPSGVRFVKATVNDVAGVIILPDDWGGYYTFNSVNNGEAPFSANIITLTDWTSKFESVGAVFLPAAGERNGTNYENSGEHGDYWVSSHGNWARPPMSFGSFYLAWDCNESNPALWYGGSVRLVRKGTYSVEASPSSIGAGTITGSGSYELGQTCTLTAMPTKGYVFNSWIENDEVVSTDTTYTFIVNGDRNLTADFIPDEPLGGLKGLFSVSSTNKVFFSKGNLQYQASTDTWRFAENQWDIIGADNENISSSYNGWIDLFGWGTGNNPTNISTNNSDYNIFTDWGTKPISIGGNQANQWRTLSKDEWKYLLNNRATTSGLRFAKATVNGVRGVIILPNDWSSSYYTLSNANSTNASFNSNTITNADWIINFEAHGAVFLPAAGFRSGTSVYDPNWQGLYWSSSPYSSDYAYRLRFRDLSGIDYDYSSRISGYSARLVCEEKYSIDVTSNPTNGGTITGACSYGQGQIYTLTATPASGYVFINWTENGEIVSTNATYIFAVEGSRTLVANFALINKSRVEATSNPTDGGTVTGTGTYDHGQICTLMATPSEGYAFSKWMENGEIVSTDATYSFIVNDDRNLTAIFISQDGTLIGGINGLFSVSDSNQVRFSKGNLQYQASTNLWRFAEHQWDTIGADHIYLSPIYNGSDWIDLFGWGTGCNPTGINDIFTDWGINPINNGGNRANLWRTLTSDEWNYLMFDRITTSGVRFAQATVNGVTGVIILPDDWNTSYYTLNRINGATYSYTYNTITYADWIINFEAHGAVFLPAAGLRNQTTVSDVGANGYYWSSSPNGFNSVKTLYFTGNGLSISDVGWFRCCSVRLVYTESAPSSCNIGVASNPAYGGSVTGSGTYNQGQTCTLTATPAIGYVFSNWTENGEIVSTNAIYSFNVSNNSSLVANFTPQSIVPTGSANSLFSVSDTSRVYFSKGNLQYQASTDTWRFAENQWDFVGTQIPCCGDGEGTVSGSDNVNISPDYIGWIDLFGWGTGNNPTNTSTNWSDYGSFTDWGSKPISNGGNQANQWYTLTKDEWDYLMNTRTTTSGIRFAKATVNGVVGIIILPDNWDSFYYTLYSTNYTGASFSANIITSANWTSKLEAQGAVFLPAAGFRWDTEVGNVNELGFYWSSFPTAGLNGAYCIYFEDNPSLDAIFSSRCYGLSVRLVCTEKYSVDATANPTNGGTVIGTGTYDKGQTCTLTATPAEGYEFSNWTENNEVVSTNASYTFSVNCNRILTANFILDESDGLFSVSGTTQVYFSKGNLQYQASTDTWRFAENPWDIIGTDNANISPTYNDWIDLFGWGTGNNPTNSSTNSSSYSTFTDWGIEPISNGGNQANLWRTLSKDEWEYLLGTRITTSGKRYAKATVNGIAGLIILPDDWKNSYYTLNSSNSSMISFTANTITLTDWTSCFEAHGAVFLPAAGYRFDTSVGSVCMYGLYWSSTPYDSNDAYGLNFYGSGLSINYNGRGSGQSVRLVSDPE